MVVPEKVLVGALPKKSWMIESLSKPPGGKRIMVDRSLLEGCSGKVKLFNPSEEDVILDKNTHTALVHPVDLEDPEQEEKIQTDKEADSARKITRRRSKALGRDPLRRKGVMVVVT